MTVPLSGESRLARALRAWRARGRARAVVLLYHRVRALELDPWELAVTPAQFTEHLRVLQGGYRVVSLHELLEQLESGRLRPRTVAITFDDGYEDVRELALPGLRRAGLPATLFAVSGMMGAHQEFWWDRVEAVLLRPGTLPPRLELRLGDGVRQWALGDARALDAETLLAHRAWRGWEPPPTPRHRLFQEVWSLLGQLDAGTRHRVLEDLAAWAGYAEPPRAPYLPLTAAGLRELQASGLVTIGAHTVTHPSLASLSQAEQWHEIATSKAALEELLQRPVRTFSYPFGGRANYTSDTAALVQRAGFAGACINVGGWVDGAAAPYEVPRVYVSGWSGREFAERLRGWFEA